MTQAFVRQTLAEAKPAPSSAAGPVAWMRANLFSGPLHALLTLAGAAVAALLIWTLVRFTIIDAVWTGADRDACLDVKVGRHVGACWPYVTQKFGQFMYGFYPADERWRVNVTALIGIALVVPLLWLSLPYKKLNAIAFFGIYPVLAFMLLVGGPVLVPWATAIAWASLAVGIVLAVYAAMTILEGKPAPLAIGAAVAGGLVWFGLTRLTASGALATPALPFVETRQWGGFLITMVVAVTGIVTALPIGIVLALGRRSRLPIARFLSVLLIEVVRGVPLITVLFFATYVLPLFLSKSPDALVRVLVGVSIFSGAYMAEVIRGGLQAIPKGQFEGAMAVGLSYPQMMGLVVLPQALKLVVPGIVNTFIGLFKDTTLVLIVSIFDLLGQIRSSFSDANWATPVTLYTGFAFAGIIYFLACYFMSRYSIFVERRFNTGHKR